MDDADSSSRAAERAGEAPEEATASTPTRVPPQDGILRRGVYRFVHWFFYALTRPFFRIEVEGRPPLESMGPVVLAPNHASFLDPPVMQFAANRPHLTFIMTETIYRMPAVRWLFKLWRAIPIPDKGAAAPAMRAALRALGGGRPVVIFPEGGISKDGYLKKGKPGVAMLIAKGGVPVIPVAILGTYKVLPRGKLIPRRGVITVRFGDPVAPPESDDRQALKDFAFRIMDAIAAMGAPTKEAAADAPDVDDAV